MGEAIIFVVLMLLSVLGLYKLLEILQKNIFKDNNIKTFLVCKVPKNCKDAEMLVRGLAADAQDIVSAKGCVVLLVNETDDETEKICRNTARQYPNVIVSNTLSIEEFLD